MLKNAATTDSPPALPVIVGDEATDLTLAIYTPRSPCSTITAQYSNDRLAELGKQVFAERRDSILDDDEILSWLGLYPEMEQRFLQRVGLDPLHDREASIDFELRKLCSVLIATIGDMCLLSLLRRSNIYQQWKIYSSSAGKLDHRIDISGFLNVRIIGEIV
ncbi:hypothetical protein HHX47_DHR1000168 [Lentinula edodes]|nr:hypothetical protein HHX47_DHR1000168 [Lentinula edodes]